MSNCSCDRLNEFDAAHQSGRIVGGVFPYGAKLLQAKAVLTTRSRRRGFTLVELVLVMIIIGVISAIAMPRFAQATARQQLNAAANRLVSDIEKAQHHARATSNAVTLSFDTSDSSYTFAPVYGADFEVQLDESPYQVSIPKASFDGATTVSFNGFGIPSGPGQVVLTSGSGSVIVSLGENGRVTR